MRSEGVRRDRQRRRRKERRKESLIQTQAAGPFVVEAIIAPLSSDRDGEERKEERQ